MWRLGLCVMVCVPTFGADLAALVPWPAQVQMGSGQFDFLPSTAVVVADKAPADVAVYLATLLRTPTGYELPVAEGGPPETLRARRGQILLCLTGERPVNSPEEYTLTVTPERVLIEAPVDVGLFRGAYTLLQLLTRDIQVGWSFPAVEIHDWPRYRWRGMLLDCSRHFMSKDFVKRYIDLLAYHKMNVLHWHLTDDQGWRIEIKKYPKLTEVGAWRTATRDSEQPRDAQGRYGGFYTQADVRELVAYAKSHYIMIVPEIEMPGHCQAALASYPELSCRGTPLEVGTAWGVYDDVYCAGNDHVFEFLQDVLSEVVELFPAKYIHIGGDEVPRTRWHECPKCQARMKAEGLKTEDELESYFIQRVEELLRKKHRHVIGWDEILEGGLPPRTVVQSWRGMKGALAAANANHLVIASPTSHCYLDYPQFPSLVGPGALCTTLEKAYSFEPMPPELTGAQTQFILGSEGNMWTERAPESRVDHMVFPRLCALAEVGWSPASARNYADFERRMKTQYERLDALHVQYAVPPPQLTKPEVTFMDALDVSFVEPPRRGVIRYTLDGSEPTATAPQFSGSQHVTESTLLKARTFLPTGNASDVIEYKLHKLRPHEPVTVPRTQPGLKFEYYEGTWEKLPDCSKLTPVATGIATAFQMDGRRRDENYVFKYSGYFKAPAEGVYTFYVASDDGSRLLIGDEVVVDNDGLHAMGEASGPVYLKPGLHPITIEYLQAGGVARLEISYQPPNGSRQPLPEDMLSHALDE